IKPKNVSRQFGRTKRKKNNMNKITYSIFTLCLTIFVCFGFATKNSTQKSSSKSTLIEERKDSVQTLRPEDLNVKSFLKLFTEKYDENKNLNLITLSGEFPKNWVKDEDIDYLMSLIKSERKCCSYINIYSSAITNEEAEVGGFAIIFMNSYIENKKINLGLTSSPKTDTKAIERIESWYRNRKNK
ncbi:hypothetical protein ABGT15_13820, partial [Flavobacterium enshiense]|uniref:hypothetical protein n=1 Tax=Flavobacterium enshiense TaxID=1341165 RepID=UPI00345CC05C